MLRIPFNEIPEDGLQVNVNDVSWFPDQEVSRRGYSKAAVFLERSGERVLITGSIEVVLVLNCDRCLEEFVSPRKIDFQLVLEVSEPGDDSPEQLSVGHEFALTDTDVVVLDEPVVDLEDLLYQQLILSLPRKILCRWDCKGICGQCGANLNLEPCGCQGDMEGGPFTSLRKLLKDKK